MRKRCHELTALIERDEDGFYVARVPDLKSCYTQARDLVTLRKRLREVIALCLREEQPDPMRFVAVEQIEV